MAGYPPPPFGFDARQQARFARQQYKAQARAALLAAKAQRYAYRNQLRAMRRGSIVGPILIVAIGVVLLLIQFGSIPAYRFEEWYSRWWPLILVVAGLILAGEWAFDNQANQTLAPGALPVRRGVGAGVIFLLILLALTGASISGLHDGQEAILRGLHIDPNNLGEFLGDRHDFEQQIDQPFAQGTALTVDNPHGDVTVTGKSDDNKIHIVVNKQVYTWGDHDASARADELAPRVSLFAGTLSISIPNLDAAHADLSITLPDSAQTTITANHGDITVSDLRAPLTLTANHGDIEVDRITGAVTAHVNSASDSFTAHDIDGDVTLRGHADELAVSQVTGAVSLEGEFFGDTHLEHLAGPVSFHTDRTQFSVGRLDGMVDISTGSEMTGSELTGPIELHTRSRNISFERIAGPVSISNSHGTVDLTSAAPLGNVSVDNTNGEVSLTVPEHAGLTVQAQAKDGGIDDELDDTHIDDNPNATHSATIGDGAAHVTLHTSHADITIHKGFIEPPTPPVAPPAAPAPPAQPAAPAKPAKLSHHSV